MLFRIFTGDMCSNSLSVFYIPWAVRWKAYRKQTGIMNLYPLWRSWIKLYSTALEKSLALCDAFLMTNFNYLPFLQTEKLMDMGKIIHTNKLLLAFSYCNLFFKMSENMQWWWDTILQNAWLTNKITGLTKIFHSSRILHIMHKSLW
jgi:hypothetical protein